MTGGARTALVIGDLASHGEELRKGLEEQGLNVLLHNLREYSAGEISAAVVEAEEKSGRVDVLCYCAGLPLEASMSPMLLDVDESGWDLVMDRIPKGFFLSCKCALPYLIGGESPCVCLYLPDRQTNRAVGAHVRAALSACDALVEYMKAELSSFGVEFRVVDSPSSGVH